jgi:hypothetical protein
MVKIDRDLSKRCLLQPARPNRQFSIFDVLAGRGELGSPIRGTAQIPGLIWSGPEGWWCAILGTLQFFKLDNSSGRSCRSASENRAKAQRPREAKSGNETNARFFTLLVKNMLCSKLHCQKI